MTRFPSVEQLPEGRRVVVDRLVPATVDTVWELLTDTGQWPEWGPTVSAVRASDRYVEQGATGEVQVLGGPWVPYRIVTCGESRWTWRVAGVPATGHRVEPAEAGARVAFEIPIVAAGYAPVCQRALAQIERLAADRTDTS